LRQIKYAPAHHAVKGQSVPLPPSPHAVSAAISTAAVPNADAATEIGPTISEANYATQNLGKAMICHQMWCLRSSIVQAECEKLSLGRAAQAAAQ